MIYVTTESGKNFLSCNDEVEDTLELMCRIVSAYENVTEIKVTDKEYSQNVYTWDNERKRLNIVYNRYPDIPEYF